MAFENEKIPALREKAARLPLNPGVYIMKNAQGHIIYIGKAKALRKRVSQYFVRIERHEPKVLRMVENVADFEYILTSSEFEALVLECSLIKQHRPKYNILLKDDKGYNYIRISDNERWPRITAVKRQEEDGALYLGPYMSSFAVKQAVGEAVRAFALPVCTRRFPQDIGRGRPCLNYYIHQCCAPCRGRMGEAAYNELIDNAVTFLKGGYGLIFEQLHDEMEQAAQKLDYEKAAVLRDRIAAIRKVSERQSVVASKIREQDVIALASDGCSTVFEVLIIRDGRLTDKNEFTFDYMQDEKEARGEFIRRYYSLAKDAPRQIALDGETDDRPLLEQYFSGLFGHTVTITVPQKGERLRLVGLARENASERLTQLGARPGHEEKALEELGRLLGLEAPPRFIEAYDISHTAGSGMVAGMVVYENGRPRKSDYKRFIIKTLTGQDDYAAMREVVGRRLRRLEETGTQANTGFTRRPDLILLDGGRGHVSAVRPLIEAAGLDIPVFGMVKDDKHRTRAIAADGGEIEINASRLAFTLVSDIQEEVHRFAVAYHHLKQKKSGLATQLTGAPKIGA
ncbi:MAG: excinuclease ABC subunit UvrC, partial [Clostridia bacterium]|nr:excinuclease ABC subunit UvrC [Clostridia bacterium]